MSLFSSLNQSIFLRIYAGLLLVCLLVALFAQLLLTTINDERAQTYRENLATGAFYLVSEGIARQKTENAKKYWLQDVSTLFESEFALQTLDKNNFKTSEINRLEKQKSVVRFHEESNQADIFYKVTNSNDVVHVKFDKLSEQQIKGVGVLLLDDLSYYSTFAEKQKRLQDLQPYFPFQLSLQTFDKLNLDANQQAQLLRKDIVIMLRDSTSIENSSFRIIAPTEMPNTAVMLGPIKLFNWFPLNLIVSITLICMFLISLGVYALIFPLERKLQLIQTGVTKVREGKLDTQVMVLGEDEISHLAATFNNMTQHIRRLIESQRELTRAVSHELRTPVARIRFAVDMLADTDDEESRAMQRDYIDQDIEALNGLIDEILTYAKLEEGSPKMDWEEVKLKDLVEQIVRETNALGKPVEVIAGEIDEKAVACADKRYLHRVLQNLAGNATRYAEKKIIVKAWIDKKQAFISVEDDGQGISEKDREKVFIPFARLDDSRTRASGGYGLGLSIVSRIAFWFNGKMSVDESPELGGARFIMAWPVKPIAQPINADELTQQSSERKYI
ncbi:ATP-binding protein [Faucicola mancuniensis]|uniref:ATP-binding protein n=1 Tax=Faucicola mancuniensis TaxID=1309795 RepID=UPI0028ECD9FC|nr:ATP-binding protein [uncultured Moraxella sp.]